MTRAIDALEQQLGIPLFKRSTRQLVLTEQGAYFLAAPAPCWRRRIGWCVTAAALLGGARGPLRVSVLPRAGASWLSPACPTSSPATLGCA